MDSPFVEKAIPMVSVHQSTGKYVVTPEAINFLRAIQGPIAVVSVAGLYRTGKSYLLNRVLLNRSNGFGVGPTVNPCTKGLWCWGTPIKGSTSDGQQVSIIVIDTEGIGALDEDQTHDTKIFTLAILASSCFIYNSVGSIDQNAIQNLSLVVNLTKHIQLKAAGMDEEGENPNEISMYFPTFYWVVRDFSLQLQDPNGNSISSKEYLEKALAPQNGFTDDIQQKNRIRKLLSAFFKDRDCFTMIRPVVDETRLQILDQLEYDQLRPQFVHQAMNLRKRIFSSVRIKSLQNQKLNGDMYCSMINSYVNAINEGAVPNIENAWNYMCEQQCKKTLEDCYQLFIKEMKEGFRQFPKGEEEFSRCVSEAEEKVIEMFRERAVGEKSGLVMKELRNRIRSQIEEAREQNIKESNEQIRKFILKEINPIKLKLNNQQYRTYPEFEKQVALLSQRLLKQGPKLYNYKLIYMQTMRKFSSQGAEFLFKNFTKLQEKDREMSKLKQKEREIELESIRQERDSLRNQYMETTTNSDQKIADLSYKLQTMTAQLTMTTRTKDQEEKKMERQFSTKYHALDSQRKGLEERIRELMERMEQNNKGFNTEKKEWEKQIAVLDLKTKQQVLQIDQLNRKEKTLDANLNISKNQMGSQVREMTQRHEREREEMRARLKQFEQKCNELNEELTSTKEEMESKVEKFDKKQKKFKEDISNRNKQMEKIKKESQLEKKQLRDELDSLKDNSTKSSTVLEEKLREAERNLKELNDRSRKDRNTLESDKQLLQQRYDLMQMQYDTIKKNYTSFKEQHENTITALQHSFLQKNQESFWTRMTEMKSQHESELVAMKGEFQNQKKHLLLQMNNFSKKNEDYERQEQIFKQQSSKKIFELQSMVQQMNDQIKHLRNNQKTIEVEKMGEVWQIDNRYKNMIRQLENEMQQIKEKAHNEKIEQLKQGEESISQIKNGYQMQKENLERRIRNEKEKYQRRINELTAEHDRKLEEETEPLLTEIQELNQKLINLQEMLRNQSIQMQHQIDMNMKKVETLERLNRELKELSENKEKEFNSKYEILHMQAKTDKEKFESRIENQVVQMNKKNTELMTVSHIRDQLQSTVQKRQSRIKELEIELQGLKQNLSAQIQRLHSKISNMQRQTHDKMTNYERQNALLKQKNEFSLNKVSQLEKTIEMTNQVYEQKMARFKQEKLMEAKIAMERIQSEKSHIETKYKQFKISAKDLQSALKRAVTELGKQKQILQVNLSNIEDKYLENEQKKISQIASLQTELTKFRQSYNYIKSIYDIETNNYKAQIANLQIQCNEVTLKFEKERSLSEQKILFLTNSKEENKRDNEERIKKLEVQLTNLQSIHSSQKSNVDHFYNQSIRNAQYKHLKKIADINEEVLKKSSEYEAQIKEKDQQIKELKEKYQIQKLQRDTMTSKMDKRLTEVSENQRRLKEEIQRLKSERERRENEYLKRQKEEKESYKSKMAILQGRNKGIEQQKAKKLYELQKERAKWCYEKENMNTNLGNLQDQVKYLQKERDKFRIQVEKLKTQRKTTRTHSFIGTKPTFEPTKIYVQENNKENVSQQ